MIHNCYTCRKPSFHASIPVSSTEPAEPAWVISAGAVSCYD